MLIFDQSLGVKMREDEDMLHVTSVRRDVDVYLFVYLLFICLVVQFGAKSRRVTWAIELKKERVYWVLNVKCDSTLYGERYDIDTVWYCMIEL